MQRLRATIRGRAPRRGAPARKAYARPMSRKSSSTHTFAADRVQLNPIIYR